MKSKHTTLALISSLFITVSAFAQKDSSGIYKTAEDFQRKHLSYAINYKTETHQIKDNLLFNNDEIKVKHKGTTYTLNKSNTYGYRSTKGMDYRVVDNREYKIINPGEPILLYVYQHPAHSPKEAEKYGPMYFFSTDATTAPQALTKDNLKAAFPDNHKFHDALDAQFKTNTHWASYDSFHKMYKLNHILKMCSM
jgi:lipopolysaccharide export LptBFGC system permease protein LptF